MAGEPWAACSRRVDVRPTSREATCGGAPCGGPSSAGLFASRPPSFERCSASSRPHRKIERVGPRLQDVEGLAGDGRHRALNDALPLDEAERFHLSDLARTAVPAQRSGGWASDGAVRTAICPSIARILGVMTGTPAYVRNGRFDIAAANRRCFTLYSGVLAADAIPFNLARFVFLDARATDFFVEWDAVADDIVSALRIEVGRSPGEAGPGRLVGDLSTGSATFATKWARHDVRFHRSAHKHLRSALDGEIELIGDALELPGQGLTVSACTAEAGSPAKQQLDLLASWASDPKTAVALGGHP